MTHQVGTLWYRSGERREAEAGELFGAQLIDGRLGDLVLTAYGVQFRDARCTASECSKAPDYGWNYLKVPQSGLPFDEVVRVVQGPDGPINVYARVVYLPPDR